jgi:hypothetical protein
MLLRSLLTALLAAAPARAALKTVSLPAAPLAPATGPSAAVPAAPGLYPGTPAAPAAAAFSPGMIGAPPAAALPQSVPPAAPAAAAPKLSAAAQLSAAAPPPGGGPAGPRAPGGVFDGSAGGPVAPEDLPALAPAEQLDASGFYAPVAERLGWERAAEPGLRWLGFYRDLYRSLSAELPPGHPYRSETARGPVFVVGGSDVAMALLHLPRSVAGSPVNLFARSAGVSPLDLWMSVRVPGRGRAGGDELGVDPESTLSLVRMAQARAAGAEEAIDAAHANVLLKWHALALTPDGLEVRALDDSSARDLRSGVLRLSAKKGDLDFYELHYNLILAYRALEESPRRWMLEPATRELIARSAAALPPAEAARALDLAAEAVAQGRGLAKKEAVKRLLDFAGKRLGPSARAALARAAVALPADSGGLTAKQARPPRPGSRAELSRLAAPWRTDEHLRRLEAEPRAPEETFRFALIGDAEPGRFWVWRKLFNAPGVFARQLRAAERQPVDFILQLGDMVSRGILRNFLAFFRELAAIAPRTPYLTVIGNHDRRSPHGITDSKLYRSLFGRTDYWFERGAWRFVVLDSSAQRVTPEQLRWLDGALDTGKRTIVFTHVPPASISAWTDFGRLKGVGGFKTGADAFTEIVARRGVERVYVGHVHALDAREHRGATYVLTGGGGSPLYPTKAGDARHHYLVVELGPEGLTEMVHSLERQPEALTVRRD